jgi:hypothetical protein
MNTFPYPQNQFSLGWNTLKKLWMPRACTRLARGVSIVSICFLVNAFPTSKDEDPSILSFVLKRSLCYIFILISSLYVTVLFHRIIPLVSIVNAVKTWHLSFFYIIKFTLVSIFYFLTKKLLNWKLLDHYFL